MHEPSMTDAEVELAMEVHEHNLAETERHGTLMLVAEHLGLSLPHAEKTDADGRWTYDPRAVGDAIGAMDLAATEAALARARTRPERPIGPELLVLRHTRLTAPQRHVFPLQPLVG